MGEHVHDEDLALGFVSARNPDTSMKWTLTTRLGAWLAEAEQRFGSRDNSYTLLGVEIFGEVPCVWYPGDRRHIAIRLSDIARLNLAQAMFQLAHEIIHVLAPTGGSHANVLEEGLATLFADEKGRESSPPIFTGDAKYIYCKHRVQDLLNIRPDAITAIRSSQPSLCLVAPELIRSIDEDITKELADSLCESFTALCTRF